MFKRSSIVEKGVGDLATSLKGLSLRKSNNQEADPPKTERHGLAKLAKAFSRWGEPVPPPVEVFTKKRPSTSTSTGDDLRKKRNRISLQDEPTCSTPIDVDKRVLCLDTLPSRASVANILSHVSGGPLEKVVIRTKDGGDLVYPRDDQLTDWSTLILELYFMREDDAASFMAYCDANMFTVNGMCVKPVWRSDIFEGFFPNLSELVYREMEDNGARRCLLLKKVLMQGADSFDSLSLDVDNQIDVHDIKRDFSRFGDVAYVTPVVSRSLSFAVHFYDVRAAMSAKTEIEEQPCSPLCLKYLDWQIWYSKDPADKPCLSV